MPSKITRQQLRHDCMIIAPGLDQALAEKHGQRVGFVLMLFDFTDERGGDGSLAYISNADRAGMIGAVKEWLARQEAGVTSDPPGPKIEA